MNFHSLFEGSFYMLDSIKNVYELFFFFLNGFMNNFGLNFELIGPFNQLQCSSVSC